MLCWLLSCLSSPIRWCHSMQRLGATFWNSIPEVSACHLAPETMSLGMQRLGATFWNSIPEVLASHLAPETMPHHSQFFWYLTAAVTSLFCLEKPKLELQTLRHSDISQFFNHLNDIHLWQMCLDAWPPILHWWGCPDPCMSSASWRTDISLVKFSVHSWPGSWRVWSILCNDQTSLSVWWCHPPQPGGVWCWFSGDLNNTLKLCIVVRNHLWASKGIMCEHEFESVLFVWFWSCLIFCSLFGWVFAWSVKRTIFLLLWGFMAKKPTWLTW